MSRHKHMWSRWEAGEIYEGWSLGLEGSPRTRMIRQCKTCGKPQVTSIRGRWKN